LEMFKVNIKRMFLYILILIVFFLIINAFYCNRYKFYNQDIIRYTNIILDKGISLDELADKYSNTKTKKKFLSEIRRVNSIDTLDYIPGDVTIIIPVLENN
jgi:hypothetical protein